MHMHALGRQPIIRPADTSPTLPGVLIQTWGAVWQYFEEQTRDKRAYTVDFERFDQRKPSRVEIYIAVR